LLISRSDATRKRFPTLTPLALGLESLRLFLVNLEYE
jgi:hypothetical protein